MLYSGFPDPRKDILLVLPVLLDSRNKKRLQGHDQYVGAYYFKLVYYGQPRFLYRNESVLHVHPSTIQNLYLRPIFTINT